MTSAESLVSTIAHALHCPFDGTENPWLQLVNYLSNRELLLVLDSFEHLLAEVGVLANILQHAAQIKFLVTSRERLNLQGEWVLHIGGLPHPDFGLWIVDSEVDDVTQVSDDPQSVIADSKSTVQNPKFAAAQLFLERARRVQPGFVITPENAPWVFRICQLVEGMPLAIELAAPWVRALSCQEIAQEIAKTLDFLATSLHDVPSRHRSVRAVFDHSWKLLSEEERGVLQKLSVFRGGFRREAAAEVAGASAAILSTLIDKSLLQRSPAGRYESHELLRRYSAQRLAANSQEQVTVQDRHCAYYLQFLERRDALVKGARQKEALTEIAEELDNIRAAWLWASARGKVEEIGRVVETLFRFHEVRSWFQEGKDVFKQAAEKLEASLNQNRTIGPTELRNTAHAIGGRKAGVWGKLIARQGWFCYRLGQYEQARELFQCGLAIARRLGCREEIASCLNDLGNVADSLGEYTKARQRYEESLSIYQELANRWGTAIALFNLARVARRMGEYSRAAHLFQESLALFNEIGDLRGKALSLNGLGDIARGLHEHTRAKRLYQESLTIYRELGDRMFVAYTLQRLGDVAVALGQFNESQQYFSEGLQIASQIQAAPRILNILVGVAALLMQTDSKGQALDLLVLALRHPASRHETKNRAEQLVSLLTPELPPHVLEIAQQSRKASDLLEVSAEVARLLNVGASRPA